jgi:membrane-associated phospholipid phosphatase
MIIALTNFADQAVILPVWLIACIGFFIIRWPRAGVAWLLIVPFDLALVLVGKLTVVACRGVLTQSIGLFSPSGHTASAALVYGGLIALLVRARHAKWLALIAATVAGTAIALSRVLLGFHGLADVLMGAPIGVLGAVLVVFAAGEPPPVLRFRGWVTGIIVVAIFILHGTHLAAENEIQRMARGWSFWGLCQSTSVPIHNRPY